MRFFPVETKLTPWYARFALIIGGSLIVFGLMMLSVQLANPSMTADFSQDYLAAKALLNSQTIYNPEFRNNHPPLDIVLFIPLTLLSYRVAFLVWSALSLVCYGAIGWMIFHELRISIAGHWRLLLIGFALCWYPFQGHMALGQWSLLLTACLLASWALLHRGRDRLAGVLVGMACLFKLFPGLVVIYLLLRRRWWAAIAASVTVAIGGLVTLAIAGPRDTLDFFLKVAPSNAAALAAFPLNSSITGAFSRLLVDSTWVRPLVVAPELATWLIRLSSLGLLVALARWAWLAPLTRQGDDATFAATCLAMLLISPLTWQHTFPLLALPFGLLLAELLRRPSWRGAILSLLALLLVSLPDIDIARALMSAYKPEPMPWFAALPLLAPTVGLLLLWWLTAAQLRNSFLPPRHQDTKA